MISLCLLVGHHHLPRDITDYTAGHWERPRNRAYTDLNHMLTNSQVATQSNEALDDDEPKFVSGWHLNVLSGRLSLSSHSSGCFLTVVGAPSDGRNNDVDGGPATDHSVSAASMDHIGRVFLHTR